MELKDKINKLYDNIKNDLEYMIESYQESEEKFSQRGMYNISSNYRTSKESFMTALEMVEARFKTLKTGS